MSEWPSPFYFSMTSSPSKITQLPLTHGTLRARLFGSDDNLSFPCPLPSFIRPASCLLNLYLLFYPQIQGATQYPLRRRGQRLVAATRAQGAFVWSRACIPFSTPAQIV